MLIPRLDLKRLGLFAWCDAANKNRVDGTSTQGYFIGASHQNMLKGDCEVVAPLAWNSSKIQRVCRSPGAAEAAAAVNTEDALYFARFQMAEMLGTSFSIRHVNCAVSSIHGTVTTDSRNVYDKLSTEVLCTKGSERRVDIELMGMKHAQLRNHVTIRWVHSEAQLANSLTKNELRQLQLFYSMKQKWKIVQDVTMSSARRRREKGQDPMENTFEGKSHHTTYRQQGHNQHSPTPTQKDH